MGGVKYGPSKGGGLEKVYFNVVLVAFVFYTPVIGGVGGVVMVLFE